MHQVLDGGSYNVLTETIAANTFRENKIDSTGKGAHMGFFELGSTVVLLFERDTIEFDEDLRRNTERDVETYVRCGDSLGRVARSAGS